MDERVMDEHEEAVGEYGQSGKETATAERVRKYLKKAKRVEKRWRPRAQKGIDFFFDQQWKKDDERAVEQRGQDAIVNNVLRPTVRLVIGLMLGQPFDWAAKPQGTHDDEAAQRVTAGLKFLAGRNKMLSLMRQVYWWGLCYGVAWVIVGPYVRWNDPRKEICQVRVIDAREAHPDPDSRELDGSDMKWFIWSRRMDVADVRKKWKNLPKSYSEPTRSDDKDSTGGLTVIEAPIDMTPPPSLWEEYADWNLACDDDEYDAEEKQVDVHECWEIVDTPVWLADTGAGSPVELDENDLAGIVLRADVRRYWHDEAPKVWKHVVCGPFLLESGRAPAKHDRIPCVPYYYDRDGKGDPWSFIESLKDPQREVNYLRVKALHELGTPRIRVRQAVLDKNGMTLEEFAAHYAKPGAVIVADQGDIEVIKGNDTSAALFQMSQEAGVNIQKNSGGNDHLMGYDTPAESGKSKELSMSQGATMQRDGEAALRAFHQAVGELLLSDMCQYHDDTWTVRITDEVGRDQFVSFNEPGVDPQTGMPVVLNDLNQYVYDVELESAPWSPTMRQRAAERIIDLFQSEENPIIRAALRRMAITLDDLPNKAQILDVLNQAEQAASDAAAAAQMQAQAAAGPPPGAPPPDPNAQPESPAPIAPAPPEPGAMPLEVPA